MARKPSASNKARSEADKRVEAAARKLGFVAKLPPESEMQDSLFERSSSPDKTTPQTASQQADLSASHQQPSEATPSKNKNDLDGKPHYLGHRERLRQRFAAGGGAALADYELLELILFRALPRRDTKPIAKELIARFGSFAEVINASEPELRKVKYIKDAAINEFKLVRASTQRLLTEDIAERPILSSWTGVLDHCRAAMAYEPREQFRILFLDKRNRLILDEVQQTGTIDHTPVYVREVCRRALEVNATAIILAHNHPSGDPTPSSGDISMTKEVVKVAKGLGITVHDHIIIAKEGHASFKALGLI